jgi:hypothetical protein
MPYLVWPVLMLGFLSIPWLKQWSGVRWSFNSNARDALACLALFVITVGVRYPLAGYGLPYQAEWDEVITYTRALGMLSGKTPMSVEVPGYGRASYGDLLVYTTTLGEVAGLLNGLRTQQVGWIGEFVMPAAGIGSIFEGVHESGIPLLYPRILLVLLNSLVPPLIYVALRKYLDQPWWAGIAGGYIYAVFSRDVVFYSSYIMPDALATTFSLGAFLAAVALTGDKAKRWTAYMTCGIFVGLALSVSIRYTSMLVVPFLALALSRDRSGILSKIGAGLGGVIGGFVATSPRILTDLSGYLTGMTTLTWLGSPAVQNRLESLVTYMRMMFAPSSISPYVDSTEGGVGLGLLSLLLALLGLAELLMRRPRVALLLLLFGSAHLYVVTPIKQNFSRHVLVLYPLVCILAGIGLSKVAEAVGRLVGDRKAMIRVPPWLKRWRSEGEERVRLGSALVFAAFLLLSAPQLRLTLQYAQDRSQYKTTQVLVAEYLEETLQPGEKVGILDIVPWYERDLHRRGIEFVRIELEDSLAELRALGITHVVGSDRLKGEYPSVSGTIWDTAFDPPGAKLAEFGSEWLSARGYPMGRLYLFVARMPAEDTPLEGG